MYRPIFLIALTTACTFVASAQPQPQPQVGTGPVSAQGWTPAQQRSWYYTTQGSRLMPLSWFQALEQPTSTQPFLTPAYIESFGLLYDAGGVDDLPVGFAANDADDTNLSYSKLHWYQGQGHRDKWVGLTCSACHTAQLEFAGTPMRIDGGPSLFDFQSFIEALDAALTATLNDPAKFGRFAPKVLGAKDNAGNRALLRGELQTLIAWEARVEAYNQTPLRYGHGRVDAFGHIFNKIALFAGTQQPIPNPADAPVSYPFLWDIYRHDKLQWNGIVKPNRLPLGPDKYLDYGALGRNTGEVLGVFGDVVIKPRGGLFSTLGGYESSVHVDNLDALETQLRWLRPPRWPGSLNATMVANGRKWFHDYKCDVCHKPQPPGNGTYAVWMEPLKQGDPNNTDPWMACNALIYSSPTVKLKGTRAGYLFGDRLSDEAPLAQMLQASVIGTLVGQKGKIVKRVGKIIVGPPSVPQPDERGLGEQSPLDRCFATDAAAKPDNKLMHYKGRPLDGIWATAPYLHNGSVPTLYDLLRAPADRPRAFYVGTRVYDPVNVGYRADQAAPGNVFRFQARDAQGVPISRNSNEGHDYGVGNLTEAQRRELLEYLKSL